MGFYIDIETGDLKFTRNTPPAGSDTQVQFNDGGIFGADSAFTFDKTTGQLSVPTLTDNLGFDVIKVSSRQLLTPDETVIFDWSQNGYPIFKAYANVSGFYFEGNSSPYFIYDIGSDTMSTGNANRFIFNNAYIQMQILEDSSAYTSIHVPNRQLLDTGGIYPAIDWANYWLLNIGITNSVPLLDWSTSAGGSIKIYYGYNNAVVGDFTNCQLSDTNSSLRVDWLNMYLYDNMNQVAVDWNYHTLWYLGSITVDWQNKYLVHDGGGGAVNSVEWGNFKLNNSGGFLSVDYGNHQLYNLTGATALLNYSSDAIVLFGSEYAQNGAIWHDTNQLAMRMCMADIYQSLQGIIFTQVTSGSATNTAAETTISNTTSAVGTLVIPPNFFKVGKQLRIKATGIHGATASPNLTVKIKFGSTVIGSTGAVATGNSTNEGWELEFDIVCRSTGVSGTVMGGGSYVENATTAKSFGMINTSTVTVNTTTSQTITLTAQFSAANAANTITCQTLSVEVLN